VRNPGKGKNQWTAKFSEPGPEQNQLLRFHFGPLSDLSEGPSTKLQNGYLNLAEGKELQDFLGSAFQV
jgi:hypothetical protein